MSQAIADDATLCVSVGVIDEDGERHVFARGERPPDWAIDLITNPTVWGDANGDQLDDEDDPPIPGSGQSFVSFMSEDAFQDIVTPPSKKAAKTSGAAKKSRR